MTRKQSGRALLLSAISLVMLGACATIESSVDIAGDAHFGDLSTYAWDPEGRLNFSSTTHPDIVHPVNQQRVRKAIERELDRKGYRLVSNEDADLTVSFTLATREHVQVQQYYDGYARYGFYRQLPGFTRRAYSYPSVANVNTFTEGSLVVDVYDNRAGAPLWHGFAIKRISRADRKDATRLIAESVEKLLAEFPDRATRDPAMISVR